MANKLKATFEFESEVDGKAEAVKAKVVWDSTTQQLTSEGVLYPWMVRAVMDFIEKVKDQTRPPKTEPPAPPVTPQRSLREASRGDPH